MRKRLPHPGRRAFARLSVLSVAASFAGLALALPAHAIPLVAVDDAYSTTINTVLDSPTSLLANDTGAAGMGAQLGPPPAHGTVTLNDTVGNFHYVPAVNFVGTDTFTYCITNGLGCSSEPATVTITILAPIANDDSFTVIGSNVHISQQAVLSNDQNVNDSLGAVLLAPSTYGSFDIDPSSGDLIYIPGPGFFGHDSFPYCLVSFTPPGILANSARRFVSPKVQLTPGDCASNVAAINITVPFRNAANAVADHYSITEGSSLNVSASKGPLANDTHPAGLGIVLLTANAKHGTLILGADGHFSYTPKAGFVGTDTFSYALKYNGTPVPLNQGFNRTRAQVAAAAVDPALLSNVATVRIVVNPLPVPAAPATAVPELPATGANTGQLGWAGLLVLLGIVLLVGESRLRPAAQRNRR